MSLSNTKKTSEKIREDIKSASDSRWQETHNFNLLNFVKFREMVTHLDGNNGLGSPRRNNTDPQG